MLIGVFLHAFYMTAVIVFAVNSFPFAFTCWSCFVKPLQSKSTFITPVFSKTFVCFRILLLYFSNSLFAYVICSKSCLWRTSISISFVRVFVLTNLCIKLIHFFVSFCFCFIFCFCCQWYVPLTTHRSRADRPHRITRQPPPTLRARRLPISTVYISPHC